MQNFNLKPKILSRIEKKLIADTVIEIKINSKVLELSSAHLYYFQPFIIKCIRCEDT
jgi:hypothetical protein